MSETNTSGTSLQKEIMAIAMDSKMTQAEKTKKIQLLYSKLPNPSSVEEVDAEDLEIDCKHYKRNNIIKSACCSKWYGCRLCHNEQVTDHGIDRHQTQTMMCIHCKTIQAVNDKCINESCVEFKETFYYCPICKFWSDDKEKDIYHCAECGICRVGKKEDYFHCDRCKLCFPEKHDSDRNCLAGASEDKCPVCFVYMQDSRESVHIMECGHGIHSKCFKEYQKSGLSYVNCPLCKKSILKPEQQIEYNKMVQAAIDQNKMPHTMRKWTADILCNDCQLKSSTSYHFYGHKCSSESCGSFNTTITHVEQTKNEDPEEENDNGSENTAIERVMELLTATTIETNNTTGEEEEDLEEQSIEHELELISQNEADNANHPPL